MLLICQSGQLLLGDCEAALNPLQSMPTERFCAAGEFCKNMSKMRSILGGLSVTAVEGGDP